MVLALAVLIVSYGAILLTLVYTVRTGISPVPTAPGVRSVLLEALPGELEGTVFELGSGWGTLAFPLARRYPGCRVEAYELSPLPWLFSRVRQGIVRLPNLTLHRADFQRVSLTRAALVVCYLYPGGMERLRSKFETELAPGTRVVSNFFAVRGWAPEAVHRAGDVYESPVYVYRAPARVSPADLVSHPLQECL